MPVTDDHAHVGGRGEPATDLRHNFIVHTIDASFFGLALGVASFVSVLPLFLDTVTDAPLAIGLIASIQPLGWHLPQLLTADRVNRLRRYMPTILRATTLERIPFFVLAGLAWQAPHLPPGTTLVLTYAIVLWIGIGGGLTSTPYQAMVAKIIPPVRQGAFYGLKTGAANLMLAIGAVGAGRVLERWPGSGGFAACFAAAGLATVVSWFWLARTREPDAEPVVRLASGLPAERLRARAGRILARDANFRWFLVARTCAQATVMAAAYYTVYAVQRFGAGPAAAGYLAATFAVAQTVGNPAMGWLGDRWGHRRTMALGMLAGAGGAGIALAAPGVLWLHAAFFLTGLANVAAFTLPLAYILRFGAPDQRTAYIGLSSSLTAPSIVLAPIVGGWLAGAAGFGAAFAVAAAGGLAAAAVLGVKVREPGGNVA